MSAQQPSQSSTGLRIRGLDVVYPATRTGAPVRAVDGVDLDLPAGTVTALLGASGSGKSSLLRAVAGLEDASGTIEWDGHDVVRTPVHERGFGLMFQDGQLFPFRDVAGNVAYGLAGRRGAGRARLSRAERDERVAEVLELVGLPGYGPRPVTTLSGGQAQRVALARALAPRPRLLLLDEPLSALDRALREQLAVDLRRILTSEGTTALYVTHDQDEAMTVADRVGVMGSGDDAGRLLRLDSPERLWADPGSESVARFLGFGPVLGPDGAAPLGRRGALAAGERLALAPGALVPTGEPEGTTARIAAVRASRGRRLLDVELDLPGGPVPAVVETDPGEPAAVGGELRVRLDPARAVVVTA